jgi:hypothetical protein
MTFEKRIFSDPCSSFCGVAIEVAGEMWRGVWHDTMSANIGRQKKRAFVDITVTSPPVWRKSPAIIAISGAAGPAPISLRISAT